MAKAFDFDVYRARFPFRYPEDGELRQSRSKLFAMLGSAFSEPKVGAHHILYYYGRRHAYFMSADFLEQIMENFRLLSMTATYKGIVS